MCRILFALDGDVVGEGSLDTLTSICLLRPLPIEETQWLIALERAQNDRRELCFVSMDRANVLLETAFDKSYRRMYLMTQYAAGVADEADVAVKRAKRPKPGASLLAQLDRSLKDASEDSLRACLSQLASADEATCERVLHLLEGLNAASSEGSADEDGDNGGQGAAAWLGGASWNRGSKLQRKAGQRRAGDDEDSD